MSAPSFQHLVLPASPTTVAFGADLPTLLARSERWARMTADLLHGRDLADREPRTWMAATLYHLSIGHQFGIHALVRDGINGSATALVRPQLEAYLRGLWVRHIADDDALSAVERNERDLPGVRAIIAKLPADHERVRDIVTPIWSDLCDYTHGGFIQIAARAHETGIGEQYRPGHMEILLATSCTLLVLGAVGMAELMQDESLGEVLWDAFVQIMKPG